MSPPAAQRTWAQDAARIERARAEAKGAPPSDGDPGGLHVAPGLRVVRVGWRGLPARLDGGDGGDEPLPGHGFVLVWRDLNTGTVRTEEADAAALLALKCVAEDVPPEAVAAEARAPVRVVDEALDAAVARGLLVSPPSSLVRVLGEGAGAVQQRAPAFGLQWHLTNVCDLDCRHCYDRSPREALGERDVVRGLDDLRAFCRDRFVAGDVTFTGGNPFLHPRFWAIYEAAWDRGLTPSILGNPVSPADVRRLVAIAPPTFYQVSLDGPEARHDAVRGSGQFRRVLRFLDLLQEQGVPSSVMMTVTADNLDDVIPLAELLRGRTGCFSFSRLSRAGRGASLSGPSREAFQRLLERCVEVEAGYTELHAKDGLANLVRHRLGRPLDAGCSEFGCCAAFTFLAVLPDGEVHACRKYPSPVGHIGRQRIAEIFDGPEARQCRSGSAACHGCPVEPVCGGCPAATHGSGLDPALHRDPWCFS